MKPYYEHAGITIYHGDCLEIVGSVVAHRAITDPPYGFGAYASDDVAPVVPVLASLLARLATVAAFNYPEGLAAWCVALGRAPDEWVTWWPTNKQCGRAKLLPRESEHVAIFGDVPGAASIVRPRSTSTIGRKMSASRALDSEECRDGDVWRDPSPGMGFNSHERLHMNQKPLTLMSRLVGLCSEKGDIVLDPFMGSGTTLRAAKDLGRRAIGIEIEERYCEIAAKRLAQEVLL